MDYAWKAGYWAVVGLFAALVGDHVSAIIEAYGLDHSLLCGSICNSLVEITYYLGDLNVLTGIAGIMLLLIHSRRAIAVLFVYFALHTAFDAPVVFLMTEKYGPVWLDKPYLWESIRLGWPIVAILILISPLVTRQLKPN